MTPNEATAGFAATTASSVQVGCVVAIAALLLGPATLWLAHAHQHRPGPTGWAATAATTAATGVLVATVVLAIADTGRAGGERFVMAAIAIPMLVYGLPAVLVDVTEQRLPDALTAPLLATTLLAIVVSSAVTGDWRAGLRSVLVAIVITGGAVASKGVRTAAFGWGDVKLTPSLSAVLGWSGWITAAQAAVLWAILILLTALGLAAARAARTRLHNAPTAISGGSPSVPYGPALLVGAAAALVPGP